MADKKQYKEREENKYRDIFRFLDLEEYSEGFIENGYDDLETVKLIEREDLIAIGVNRSDHQVLVMRWEKEKFSGLFETYSWQTFLPSIDQIETDIWTFKCHHKLDIKHRTSDKIVTSSEKI